MNVISIDLLIFLCKGGANMMGADVSCILYSVNAKKHQMTGRETTEHFTTSLLSLIIFLVQIIKAL